MKNYFYLLIFGVTLYGCSHNDGDSATNELIGKWNWTESFGGIEGRTDTPESTGNMVLLEISNNTIKKYVNGNLLSELNYTTEIRESTIFGEPREMIIYEIDFYQTIVLDENHLILYDECNDCFQNSYIKE